MSAQRRLQSLTKMAISLSEVLNELCIVVLQNEEVIMCVTQKSSQCAHSGCEYLSESFETKSDEVTSLDNDEQHMSIENVNQKILFQSLYELLLHIPDVVLVLSDMAEKMIRELNGRNLDQGVLPAEMGQFTTEYSNDIGTEVDKDKFTPTCVATVPEKSHYSHSTGFRVSIHYIRRDACRNVMSAVLCNNVQVTCNILNVFISNTFDITLIYFSSVQNMSIQKHFVF